MLRDESGRREQRFHALRWRATQAVVESADRDLVERAASFLGLPLESAFQAGKTDILVVRDGNLLTLESHAESFASSVRDDVVIRLTAMLALHFLQACQETVIHGGAFVSGGRAVIFCGSERAGKSSLAFTAWRLGLTVLADDWLVLERTGSVSPFPKPMKLRLPHDARTFELEDVVTGGDRLVGRLGNEIRLMLGRRLEGLAPLDETRDPAALFLLERTSRKQTEAASVAPAAALRAILDQTCVTRGSGIAAVALLERLRHAGRIFRLEVGDNDLEGAVGRMVEIVGGTEIAGRSLRPLD